MLPMPPRSGPESAVAARVDAHHHVWDLHARSYAWLQADGLGRLRRSFLAAEYDRLATDDDIGASVLVQTVAETDETLELLEVAASSEVISAVVGWVDLTADDVADQIASVRAEPDGGLLRGIRHLVQDEDDPRWLLRDDVRAGLRAVADAGLVYDLLVRSAQLPAAVETARELPEVTFVLDHAGKPDLRPGGDLQEWESAVRTLGGLENVVCKLSGLVTEADPDRWRVEDLRPAADVVLSAFGADRVMLGSDWPVCLLAGRFERVVGAYRDLLDELSEAERSAVEGGVARRLYRLA
jgi:L-fuconolactonase